MFRRIRPVSFFIWLLLLVTSIQAQDSTALTGWKVTSKLIEKGKYELGFTVPVKAGYQFYAPNESFLDSKTTELKFGDSSIVQEGDFVLSAVPKEIKSELIDNTTIKVLEGDIAFKAVIVIKKDTIPAKLQGTLFYTYGKGIEYYPTPFAFSVGLEGGVDLAGPIKWNKIDLAKPINSCGDDGTQGKDLLTIFFLGLLGGLIALLTPCVFPMIPVTVTFFTKKAQDKKQGIRNGVMYGLFIFLIYVVITIPFHIANKTNPEIFNNLSTNIWLNLLFFAIFVTFALSFFGLFEIGLPSGLANKMDSKSGIGNIAGIFFMAATLAIVSFSCTGPILGTLLVGVADQGAWPLTVGAAGFGIALGLPFALFAMFPNWLQSLPKSGGWMTDVKVVLGFLELALAVKFLSNADLVMQWGLLKRELFIALWIIIGILILLYLLGKLRIGHSTSPKRYSFARVCFIILFGAFTIYLVPGISNTKYADLKLISGFPPPRTYSFYKLDNKLFKPIHNDLSKALEIAKQENKPVLIDFTGWACVNCRRMEDNTWQDPQVNKFMRENFVVVSLYVDERTKLPLSEQTVVKLSNGAEKSIETVGDKWATFQTENFGATAQPQYAILSSDTTALTKTKYYTRSVSEFSDWLQCGLSTYQKFANRNTSNVTGQVSRVNSPIK